MRVEVHVTTNEGVSDDQAYISITFNDGSILERHIEHAVGSLEKPLTEADLKKKFMDQAVKLTGKVGAERACKAFTDVGNMMDVGKTRMLAVLSEAGSQFSCTWTNFSFTG